MDKNQEQTSSKKRRFLGDFILLIILLVISVGCLYIANKVIYIPKKWISIGAALMGVVWLIFFILAWKRSSMWFVVIRRIFIVLLCAAIGTAGYMINKSKTTLDDISTTKVNDNGTVTVRNKMYIITNKDATYETIDDLTGVTIGFQSGSDKDSATFLKEQIETALAASYTPREEMDYSALYTDLTNGNIQALAISETYYDMSAANISDFLDTTKIIATYEQEVTQEASTQKDITKETFTVYISGLDSTGSPDQQNHTDVNILMIVNPRANHIDMVSLPRDGYMPNTALSNINDKLTHTSMYGIDTSIETIENFFQIPIDYYARVSFNSLIEIVDAIGGINIDVEISFCEQDENRSFAEGNLICLEEGEQELNGKEALAYARHRKTAGYDNPGRQRAQQRIIKGIINKLMSPSTAITSINELMEIAPEYVVTNMPSETIAEFVASELENIQPWTISTISSDNGVFDYQYTASQGTSQTYDVYLFDPEDIRYVINAYDGASNQLQMSEFHFDLNDLYKDTPPINSDPNIVWDYMASPRVH